MAAKQGQGKRPGSVRERQDRPGVEARVRLPNGTRPSRYFDTKREAWAWVNQKLVEAQQGLYVVDDMRKTGDVLLHWLQEVAPKTLKPNSLYNYRRCIGYVQPWIGDIKLKDLKRPHLESTFTGLERGDDQQRPLSRSTLNLTFRVLKMALEYCVDAEYIAKNPMHRMKAPRVEPTKERVLSVTEVKEILREAHGTRWYAAFWLLGLTGMRISELLGLEWKNVNLATGVLRIEQQTGRFYGQSGVRLLPLKTRAAERNVLIPPFACQILRWQQDLQRLECKRAQEAGLWEEHGTVFCAPAGRLYFRSEPADEFRRITARVGIEDVTLHTFRHTVTTMVQEAGLSLKVAQSLMGHATDRTTHRIYSHLSATGLAGVAEVMQGLFGDVDLAPPAALLTAEEDR